MNRKIILAPILGIGLILALAAAWYLGSPLFLNRTVEEAFPFEITPSGELDSPEASDPLEMEAESEAAEAMTADSTPAPISSTPAAAASDPALLLRGEFQDADDFHQGSGIAAVYRLPDGSHVLRLESFMVTNGPDLHVLLSTSSSPTGQSDMGDVIDLGKLKGNLGDQNYEIPLDANIDGYRSVVIYCQPFHVVFSVAAFQP